MLYAVYTVGGVVDVEAARGAACRLADTFDRETLEDILDRLDDDTRPSNGRLGDLRDAVRRALRTLVDDFVESLDFQEVDGLELGPVTVYITGGLSFGDAPGGAATTWGKLLDRDAPWSTPLRSALGLLEPTDVAPGSGQFTTTLGAA
ncbi:MAG TPA: hypothetical protein VFQ85_07415 [Mycobacteriales bacterium]|jgi:hypothetical protein|nr:hypothetical protein [Mycobacteriales bacterium]